MKEQLRTLFEPMEDERGFPSRRAELEAVKAGQRSYAVRKYRATTICEEIDEDYEELVREATALDLLLVLRPHSVRARSDNGGPRELALVDVYAVSIANLHKVGMHADTRRITEDPIVGRDVDRYLRGYTDEEIAHLRELDERRCPSPGQGITIHALLDGHQLEAVKEVAGRCVPPAIARPLVVFFHRFAWLKLEAHAHAPGAMTIARLGVWGGYLATLFDLHLEDDLMIAHVDAAGVPALNAALTSRVEILTRDGWVAISDRDRKDPAAN